MNIHMQNPAVQSSEMMACGNSKLGVITLTDSAPQDRGQSSLTVYFDNPVAMRDMAQHLVATAEKLEANSAEDAA